MEASLSTGVVDGMAERAAREDVDLIAHYNGEDWRFYSATKHAWRAHPAREVAQLLMLALDHDAETERNEGLYFSLEMAIPQDDPEGRFSDLSSQVEELKRTADTKDLPIPIATAALNSRLTPLLAPTASVTYALIPGYITLIIVFAPFVLASTALVREKDAGTLFALLVSARRNWTYVVLGKLMLPIAASMALGVGLLVVSHVAFGVVIKPGIWQTLGLQLLAGLASALVGTAVSAFAKASQEALVVCSTYLVCLILLTGMVHPIEQSAPVVVVVAHLFSFTIAAPAMESWMAAGASGVPRAADWGNVLAQTAMSVALCILAVARLKARL